MHGGRGFERSKIGPQGQAEGGQPQQCAQPAKPPRAADILGKVGCEIDGFNLTVQALAPFGEAFAPGPLTGLHGALRLIEYLPARKRDSSRVGTAAFAEELSGPENLARSEQARPS